MLFTTTCWYVCWASEITAVGAIKKKALECNDEEGEFYEKHESMFKCKGEHACNAFNKPVAGSGEKNWHVACVHFLFRSLCW